MAGRRGQPQPWAQAGGSGHVLRSVVALTYARSATGSSVVEQRLSNPATQGFGSNFAS